MKMTQMIAPFLFLLANFIFSEIRASEAKFQLTPNITKTIRGVQRIDEMNRGICNLHDAFKKKDCGVRIDYTYTNSSKTTKKATDIFRSELLPSWISYRAHWYNKHCQYGGSMCFDKSSETVYQWGMRKWIGNEIFEHCKKSNSGISESECRAIKNDFQSELALRYPTCFTRFKKLIFQR